MLNLKFGALLLDYSAVGCMMRWPTSDTLIFSFILKKQRKEHD